MKIDGGCHCGSIKFEAEIDPADVGLCHCTDCQSLSGTAFTAYVFAPSAGFKLSGTPKIYYKIRQRHELRPQVQIWCRSALGWVMDLGSVKQVPRQP
jgi:Uncharacterized conserved protein